MTILDTRPGRIDPADIAQVRERVAIDEVIGQYVQLRNAGGGNLKGLCPFHDERTPSFNVTPARGCYYCFGCEEGGDAITFLQKMEHLSFAEAVQRLADRAGMQLRRLGDEPALGPGRGLRARLVAAHAAAAEFYAGRLLAAEAAPARRFLADRGFARADAERFCAGYAPAGWDALARHLLGRGFTAAELITGGLAREGKRGPIDRFRDRLVWPIRDITGDVIGFGARKLDDAVPGPKYLNTPETPIYKKSSVLYGIDLAKREISRQRQAVIVEGYTDVMACHLAGVTTAVATCGTAFGPEHVKVLRRLLMDQANSRGEVVFTFDGDAAGQKAALRAFAAEASFATQTYVAVQPDGLDPCDLRLARGDEAVRELVATREPLFAFAIRSAIAQFDLRTNEGRLAALDAAAPLVAAIKDPALRQRYAVDLDRWLGLMDERLVIGRIMSVSDRTESRPDRTRTQTPAMDPGVRLQAEALKVAIQHPGHAAAFDALPPEAFTAPACRALYAAIAAAGGVAAARGGRAWIDSIGATATPEAAALLARLAVEPVAAEPGDEARYAADALARMQQAALGTRIADAKARISRTDPADPTYLSLFKELMDLEAQRRALHAAR